MQIFIIFIILFYKLQIGAKSDGSKFKPFFFQSDHKGMEEVWL